MNAAPEEKFCAEDVSRETITTADDDAVMKISDRLLDQHTKAYTALGNNCEYKYISHEEIVEMTRSFIIKHSEAYTALANEQTAFEPV